MEQKNMIILSMLIIVFLIGLLPGTPANASGTGALNGGATPPTQTTGDGNGNGNRFNVECTVVSAYPNSQNNPDPSIQNHTYRMDDVVNLDVRGLGEWIQYVCNVGGVAAKTIQGIRGDLQHPTAAAQDNSAWVSSIGSCAKTLCLYINGKPFNNLTPLNVYPTDKDEDSTFCPIMTMRFILHRNPDDQTQDSTGNLYQPWNPLTTFLYSQIKTDFFVRALIGAKTDLTVGIPDPNGVGIYYMSSALNPPNPKSGDYTVWLLPYRPDWMIASIVIIVAMVFTGVLLGLTTDLLRDTTIPPNPGGRYPFSLGLCQMAFWTLVITSSYLFIWCSTSNYNTFNSTALILLGISSVAGLSATLINNSNPNRPSASMLSPAELVETDLSKLNQRLETARTGLSGLAARDAKMAD